MGEFARSAEGRSPFALSMRVSLRYGLFFLPGQVGGDRGMVRCVADHECVPNGGRHPDAVFRSQLLDAENLNNSQNFTKRITKTWTNLTLTEVLDSV